LWNIHPAPFNPWVLGVLLHRGAYQGKEPARGAQVGSKESPSAHTVPSPGAHVMALGFGHGFSEVFNKAKGVGLEKLL